MQFDQIKEKLLPLIQRNYLPLGLGLLGLILIIYGLMSMQQSSGPGDAMVQQAASDTSSISQMYVDVEGAVVNPGVYELASDARTKDALIAAGGLSSDADRAWVSQTVNLAGKVTDGSKIFIRAKGQQDNGSGNNTTSTGLVNINSASTSDLDGLPGVGDVTAGKIISGRPYASIEELLNKKIITQKVFDGIKDKISVY